MADFVVLCCFAVDASFAARSLEKFREILFISASVYRIFIV